MEQSIKFQYMFLQRLPATLWTLLGEQESGGHGRQAVGHSQAAVSRSIVGNVEMAEEQPAAQIVTCCP